MIHVNVLKLNQTESYRFELSEVVETIEERRGKGWRSEEKWNEEIRKEKKRKEEK